MSRRRSILSVGRFVLASNSFDNQARLEMKVKQKYLILRTGRMATADPFSPPSALGAALPSSLSVETAEIDRRDVATLARDRTVAAIAPPMPLSLITPVEMRDATAQEAAATAWGISAVGAAGTNLDGSGVTVAVLDTGIDPAHPAFHGVELTRRNFTAEADDDLHGHGTHCAGTIFGRDVDGTRIGVARGVRRALIGKVLGKGGGSSESLVDAVLWAADNGAHIVSMSLGVDFPGYATALVQQLGLPQQLAVSRALEGYRQNVLLFERMATLLRAHSQTTLVIAAAGNESRRDEDPRFEIGVSPPAVAEGIISVAALGQSAGGLDAAPFSNTGANLSAPGVAVVSARRGGGLATMSGTSMATPHTAGVAALWAQRLIQQNQLSSFNLMARLVGSCTLEGLKADIDIIDVGAGLVRAPQG